MTTREEAIELKVIRERPHVERRLSALADDYVALLDQSVKQDDLWLQFLSPNKLCGLCGNHGTIDSNKLLSPAGVVVGGRYFCICPNGRALKKSGVVL